jgi:hypothetical protein
MRTPLERVVGTVLKSTVFTMRLCSNVIWHSPVRVSQILLRKKGSELCNTWYAYQV